MKYTAQFLEKILSIWLSIDLMSNPPLCILHSFHEKLWNSVNTENHIAYIFRTMQLNSQHFYD